MIPFRDLTRDNPRHIRLMAAVWGVLDSGVYLNGECVPAFEQALADYLGVKHCIAVSSGMAALRLGLRAMGIGPGSRVLVPSRTFVGTWLAVSQVGAQVVPVDDNNWARDADAAIPVHLYGHPTPIPAHLPVLEDASQAHGAAVRGRKVGTLGDCAAFSFYPTKNLGALGDAGAVVTDDDALHMRMWLENGYRLSDSRMDEIQAAALTVELQYLDEDNARRQMIAAKYSTAVYGTGLTLEWAPLEMNSVYHQFVVYHPDRDAFRARLLEAGVETMVHYDPPPHRHPTYAKQFDCPNADRWARTVVSLPCYPGLMDAQVEQVCEAIRACV